MFPIIPYNINTRSLYHPETEVFNKLPKVVAACDLPKDCTSQLINMDNLCGKIENSNIQLEVELNNQKEVVLKTKKYISNQCNWIRYMRLADDCHSYNTKLCFHKESNQFLIQISKNIKNGQELLLWFSEDILAYLQMAFLTPANIQGQKKYVCHKCYTTFEYPNPLKLHLSLDCNKQQIYSLWDRLSKIALNEPTSFQLLKLQTKEKFSILNLSTTSEATTEIQRPLSEPPILHSSAFKPYSSKKSSPNNNTIRLTQSVSNFFTFNPNETVTTRQNLESVIDYNHAAQMETLVSNLGKSKQGHLCIYCGKCYSRKYGLKIHIRTHTGYKPLKCKYCLRPFGDPSNLNKHVRLHAEGDTPYKCELCGKILVRRRDLERHLRSRHLEDKVDNSSENSDN